MSRPKHFSKPRIKPSWLFPGEYLCWNNRCVGYGATIAEAYRAWEFARAGK